MIIIETFANPYVLVAAFSAISGLLGGLLTYLTTRRSSDASVRQGTLKLKQAETELASTYVEQSRLLIEQYHAALTQSHTETAHLRTEVATVLNEMADLRVKSEILAAKLDAALTEIESLNLHIVDLSDALAKHGVPPPQRRRIAPVSGI